MLDIKKIKENPQAVKDGLKAKEVDCDATIDRILVLDDQIRALKTASEGKTAQKNKLSRENGKLFGQKKGAEKRGEDTSAIDAAIADVKAGRTGPVPRELQNVHADGTGFERDQGYLYPHNFPNHWVRQQYLPDVIRDRTYYTYGDNKTEQAAKRYWDEIKK